VDSKFLYVIVTVIFSFRRLFFGLCWQLCQTESFDFILDNYGRQEFFRIVEKNIGGDASRLSLLLMWGLRRLDVETIQFVVRCSEKIFHLDCRWRGRDIASSEEFLRIFRSQSTTTETIIGIMFGGSWMERNQLKKPTFDDEGVSYSSSEEDLSVWPNSMENLDDVCQSICFVLFAIFNRVEWEKPGTLRISSSGCASR